MTAGGGVEVSEKGQVSVNLEVMRQRLSSTDRNVIELQEKILKTLQLDFQHAIEELGVPSEKEIPSSSEALQVLQQHTEKLVQRISSLVPLMEDIVQLANRAKAWEKESEDALQGGEKIYLEKIRGEIAELKQVGGQPYKVHSAEQMIKRYLLQVDSEIEKPLKFLETYQSLLESFDAAGQQLNVLKAGLIQEHPTEAQHIIPLLDRLTQGIEGLKAKAA